MPRLFRTVLLLLALLVLPGRVMADDWKPHASSSYSGGAGTLSAPYRIGKAADLALLAKQVNEGNIQSGVYFILTADIDLAGHNWVPIGTNASRYFAGHFDGRGYAIKNMSIETNATADEGVGLFGSVNGNDYTAHSPVVQNFTLAGATITVDPNGGDRKMVRAGFVAGFAGLNTTLANIHVTTGSKRSTMIINNVLGNTSGVNYFIGGIVGDCAITYAGYTEGGDRGVTLRNHYVDADITVNSKGSPTQTSYQHNVGGIVGRLRFSHRPLENCTYSGQINAPQCTISPSIGAVRNGGSANRTPAAYAGYYSKAEAARHNLYFTNYQIYDGTAYRRIVNQASSNNEWGYKKDDTFQHLNRQQVNDSPAKSDIWVLASTPAASSTIHITNISQMNQVQGVNNPLTTTCLDVNGATDNGFNKDVCDTYNAVLTGDNPGFRWYRPVNADTTMLFARYGLKLEKRVDAAGSPGTVTDEDNAAAFIVPVLDNVGYGEVWEYHWTRNGTPITQQGLEGEEDIDLQHVKIPAKRYEDFTWTCYATCKMPDGRIFQTNTATVTIDKRDGDNLPKVMWTVDDRQVNDERNAQVTLSAKLYETNGADFNVPVENLTWHWIRNGEEIADHHDTHDVIRLLHTLEWQVWASFDYEGFHYESKVYDKDDATGKGYGVNKDAVKIYHETPTDHPAGTLNTYTLPGNALPYSVQPWLTAERTANGVRYTATPMLNGEPQTPEMIEAKGYTVTYDWYYGLPDADLRNSAERIAMTPDRAVGFLHESSIHLFSTLRQNMPVGCKVTFYYGEELAADPAIVLLTPKLDSNGIPTANVTGATIPVAAQNTFSALIEGALITADTDPNKGKTRYHAALTGLFQLGNEMGTDYEVSYDWSDNRGNATTDAHFIPATGSNVYLTVTVEKDGAAIVLTDNLIKEDRTVVYLRLNNDDLDNGGGRGDDVNHTGLTIDSPVNSWAKAYDVLYAENLRPGTNRTKVEQNIIVVLDQNADNKHTIRIYDADTHPTPYVAGEDYEVIAGGKRQLFTLDDGGNKVYGDILDDEDLYKAPGIAATITGTWPWENTVIDEVEYGPGKLVSDGLVYVGPPAVDAEDNARIGATTRFKDITFKGAATSSSRLCCFFHDVTFDEGCKMNISRALEVDYGAISGRTAPDFDLLFCGNGRMKGSTQVDLPQVPRWHDKPMNVVIRSGRFGRIITARATGDLWAYDYKGILGLPDRPIQTRLLIDIAAGNPQTNIGSGSNPCADDIAIICAGATQGTIWGDCEINVRRGTIGSIVAGSQGNTVSMKNNNGEVEPYPINAYYGRTVVNLRPQAKDETENLDEIVQLQKYYGGGMGRRVGSTSSQQDCDLFFYGQAELNVYGGTLHQTIYGAGSGGTSGLGTGTVDALTHTHDRTIPYVTSGSTDVTPNITYDEYDPAKTITKVKTTMSGGVEYIDLAKTEVRVNIHGGQILGNIYGGGYGQSDNEMPLEVAPKNCGNLFGNTYINISGGTIKGDVYGGGRGSDKYYTKLLEKPVGDDWRPNNEAMQSRFLNVGQVYGNTNVHVTGGNIVGNIYGGGQGLVKDGEPETYLPIAKVTGNPLIVINNPDWKLGETPDDNSVKDKNGNAVTHDKDGNAIPAYSTKTTAYGSAFIGNIYGGGAHGTVEGNPVIEMKAGDIVGCIYGGGGGIKANELRKADGTGMPFKRYSWYNANDGSGDTVMAKTDDAYPANASKNLIGLVKGDTHVIITGGHIINSDDNVLRDAQNRIVLDKAGKPQEDMRGRVYGGGAYAVVDGNTTIELKADIVGNKVVGGGRIDGNIFGGGQGYVVTHIDGTDHLTVVTDSITSADVTGGTNVLIAGGHFNPKYRGDSWTDTKANGGVPFHYFNNTYGGGNKACVVGGGTRFYITHGMFDEDAIYDATGSGTDYAKSWKEAYEDEGSPCFSIFGAGYGLNTRVLGTVFLDVAMARETTQALKGDVDEFIPYQSYMEAVGGGFNGSVKGKTFVHVGGNTILRNVYGGGYYGPVGGTLVYVTGGNMDEVYGGGLMGPVMCSSDQKTSIQADTNHNPLTSDGTSDLGWSNVIIGMRAGYTVQSFTGSTRTYRSEGYNQNIYIRKGVYGGNDVSGRVEGAGVMINGGRIYGNVYGAGNGNHTGYYDPTPGIAQYVLGENKGNYYWASHRGIGTYADEVLQGKTYTGRPQTGRVQMFIGGDVVDANGVVTSTRDTEDKAYIYGQVFGGGNSCTIGNWAESVSTKIDGSPADPKITDLHVLRDHPDFFEGGGKLDVTIGSHVRIGRTHAELDALPDDNPFKADWLIDDENVSGLYMGCSGQTLATQHTSTTNNKYHRYYDATTHKYWPGFPVYEEGSSNPISRATGLNYFRAYLNNILIWSDNVNLKFGNTTWTTSGNPATTTMNTTDADQVEDIWLANFVGGGFRGSMRAKTTNGTFKYSLPHGVTIGHDVVGGAYNAHVVYRIYETEGGHKYTETDGHYNYLTNTDGLQNATQNPSDPDYLRVLEDVSLLRYNFNGGILGNEFTGTESSTNNHNELVIKAYGGNSYNDNVIDFSGYTKDQGLRKHKDKALLQLDLRCQLEPEIRKDAGGPGVDYLHGGNVFGGCFKSGFVEGDAWTDYRCYIADHYYSNKYFNGSATHFAAAKDFDHNFAMMVFGAGYGEDTHTTGDVYLRVMYNKDDSSAPAIGYPRPNGVFGGSYKGEVSGRTNVYYNGGSRGFVAGGLYGGGCKGYVGGKTFVEFAGGYAHNVYGGAREANIGGGSHVWTYNGSTRWWGTDIETEANAEKNMTVAGRLFGGSDISGLLNAEKGVTDISSANNLKGWTAHWSAGNWPEELYTDYNSSTKQGTTLKTFDSYIQIGGTEQYQDGFPMIGEVYAGGNGEETDVAGKNHTTPDVRTALLELTDGNIIKAFGGGNHATVTEATYIMLGAQGAPQSTLQFTKTQYNIVKEHLLKEFPEAYTADEAYYRVKMSPWHIQRLFGGNNIADMTIQPKWHLTSGYAGNVYSGGNHGRMLYYNPAGSAVTVNPVTNAVNSSPKGLSITIDSPDIHIGNLYGGCRMADVVACTSSTTDGVTTYTRVGEDVFSPTVGEIKTQHYGATVNIIQGWVNNVYGGNDVSGNVFNGTNVNLSGGVSGDVYGAGNGDYYYKFDDTLHAGEITEVWDAHQNGGRGAMIYHVGPMREFAGIQDLTYTDFQKVLAINAYRPHVDKAYLNIAGEDDHKVYISGSVYCGGNASSIRPLRQSASADGETWDKVSKAKFDIGKYAVVNEIFMGSNGASLRNETHQRIFEQLNGFSLAQRLDSVGVFSWAADGNSVAHPSGNNSGKLLVINSDDDLLAPTGGETDWRPRLYPHLLSLYMRAVGTKAMPEGFEMANRDFNGTTHIGTFCLGGNAGSMLTQEKINITFPKGLKVFGRIIAGCKDSRFTHWNNKNVRHDGGFRMPLAAGAGTVKVEMTLQNEWENKTMRVEEANKSTDYLVDNRTNNGHHWAPDGAEWLDGCNVYGGCYQSGDFMGDVIINLESDMLGYHNAANWETTSAAEPLRLANKRHQPVYNIYGAGYGPDSRNYGNTTINVRDQQNGTGGSASAPHVGGEVPGSAPRKAGPGRSGESSRPSANNIYGGGRNGRMIGNTLIHVYDGLVYGDVVGGCFASDLYGSSQVLVGYPQYYVCKKSGVYQLARGDQWNKTQQTYDADGDPVEVVKQSVKYLKGDIVPCNVYDQIVGYKAPDGTETSLTASAKLPARTGAYSTAWDSDYFTYTNDAENGTLFPRKAKDWSDVLIQIRGGVYGGGYSVENSTAATAGAYTTKRLKKDIEFSFDSRPDLIADFGGEGAGVRAGLTATPTAGYAGNSSVIVADNVGDTKDHIRISTTVATATTPSGTLGTMGLFTDTGNTDSFGHKIYDHHGKDDPDDDTTYYALSGEGGVFGDGHFVFCEGFRAADITGYGYDGATVKYPAMINTFQRLDLLSINDCCLMLQGAQDFATDQNPDATTYSMTRIGELRMNSSIDAVGALGQITSTTQAAGPKMDVARQRNYIGFYHNVHYLGAIVSNDEFKTYATGVTPYHGADGAVTADMSYLDKKRSEINTYNAAYDAAQSDAERNTAEEKFQARNVGTARNAVGINNGYCLRIQNVGQTKDGDKTTPVPFYGPVVGVVEAKLLTLVPGEGGGYIYADNVHATATDFLNTSGNFVFPGLAATYDLDGNSTQDNYNQYIIDDCFEKSTFASGEKITYGTASDKEGHYWYVKGPEYYYNTTLTAYTFKDAETFRLSETDPNVLLAGAFGNSASTNNNLKIKSVKWLDHEPPATSDKSHPEHDDYECSLHKASDDDYTFKIEVGGHEVSVMDGENRKLENTPYWAATMVKETTSAETGPSETHWGTSDDPYYQTLTNRPLPTFDIILNDNKDNSGRENYDNHLSEKERVEIVLTNGINTYHINLDIRYLMGPEHEGAVTIYNCALPGEAIAFGADNLEITTDLAMPVTDYGWRLVPYGGKNAEGKDIWNEASAVKVPDEQLWITPEGIVRGSVPAQYCQNKWKVQYWFRAGNHEFGIDTDTAAEHEEERYLLVHNYHRMADVKAHKLNPQAGAYVYIKDEDDLKAFMQYLEDSFVIVETDADDTEEKKRKKAAEKAAWEEWQTLNYGGIIPKGLAGIHFVLQDSIKVTEPLLVYKRTVVTDGDATDIVNGAADLASQHFCGTFHGDGHFIDFSAVPEAKSHLFNTDEGDYTCEIYNLGVVGGDILRGKFTSSDSNYGVISNEHIVDSEVVGRIVNCFEYDDRPARHDVFHYGETAYHLSHHFQPTYTAGVRQYNPDGYVEQRFANGDYQYAQVKDGADRYSPYLRTLDEPLWGAYYAPAYDGTAMEPSHDISHAEDVLRLNPGKDAVDASKQWTYQPLHGTVTLSDGTVVSGDYLNDYLFFGQHLDIQDGNEWPVAISKVANGDAEDDGKGGNRVYATKGYNGAESSYFYYNADAWVLNPGRTAISFLDVHIKSEEDGATGDIVSFDTDSNAEHDADNGTAGFQYSNRERGYVTQNLLVYHGKLGHLIADEDADSDEQEVHYHSIHAEKHTEGDAATARSAAEALANGYYPGSGNDYFTFSAPYFHLVDNQDFYAAAPFAVTDRAWYERTPERFRNVTGAHGYDSSDGKTYSDGGGWEGICLPFTVNRVVASHNGELSHFYGPDSNKTETDSTKLKHDVGHEYWLRGLTAVTTTGDDPTTVATFARPSATAGSSLFTPSWEATSSDASRGQTTGAYTYHNDYFANLPNYNPQSGSTAHYGDAATDSGYTMEDYVYMTACVPYLIAFPGNSFYEFSLQRSGLDDAGNHTQTLTFEAEGADDAPVIVHATKAGGTSAHSTAANGYTHVGTLLRTDANPARLGLNALGTAFELNAAHDATASETVKPGEIWPFRTYLVPQPSSPAPRRVVIGAVASAPDPILPAEEPEEELQPGAPALTIAIEGLDVIVTSTYDHDRTLDTFLPEGRLVRRHTATPGTTTFRLPAPGIYIIGGRKVIAG